MSQQQQPAEAARQQDAAEVKSQAGADAAIFLANLLEVRKENDRKSPTAAPPPPPSMLTFDPSGCATPRCCHCSCPA
jgi:hypothetical protein